MVAPEAVILVLVPTETLAVPAEHVATEPHPHTAVVAMTSALFAVAMMSSIVIAHPGVVATMSSTPALETLDLATQTAVATPELEGHAAREMTEAAALAVKAIFVRGTGNVRLDVPRTEMPAVARGPVDPVATLKPDPVIERAVALLTGTHDVVTDPVALAAMDEVTAAATFDVMDGVRGAVTFAAMDGVTDTVTFDVMGDRLVTVRTVVIRGAHRQRKLVSVEHPHESPPLAKRHAGPLRKVRKVALAPSGFEMRHRPLQRRPRAK